LESVPVTLPQTVLLAAVADILLSMASWSSVNIAAVIVQSSLLPVAQAPGAVVPSWARATIVKVSPLENVRETISRLAQVDAAVQAEE
jgi:hypothetical protein